MADSHKTLIEDYKKGIRTGSMHAPWKDQAWEEQHPRLTEATRLNGHAESSAQAGLATDL